MARQVPTVRRTGQTCLWEVRVVDSEGRRVRPQTWEFAKYVIVFTRFPAADLPTARRLSVIVQRSAYQGDIGPCRKQRLKHVGASQSPEPRGLNPAGCPEFRRGAGSRWLIASSPASHYCSASYASHRDLATASQTLLKLGPQSAAKTVSKRISHTPRPRCGETA